MTKIKQRPAKFRHVKGLAGRVGILVGGTAIAQAIAIIILPLLTRLYSPADFAVLAVYSSVLTLLSSVACLRFEIAIPIPRSKATANALLVLSLSSVVLVTLLSIILIIAFEDFLADITQGRILGLMWLVPLGVLLSGSYNTLLYWATREKKFFLISRTRVFQSAFAAAVQVALGYAAFAPIGLLVGNIVNNAAGLSSFFKAYLRDCTYRRHSKITCSGLKYVWRKYNKFPKYSTLEALANTAAGHVPILIIASVVAGAEVGYVMLAMRLLAAPMGLLGRAVSQVYLSEVAAKTSRAVLRDFTWRITKKLTILGAVPFLVACVCAPAIIPIAFGEEWSRVGVIIAWMAPWFFVQFVSSPVSMALHVTGNQKVALALQIAGLTMRTAAVLVCGIHFKEIIVEVYAVSGLLFYLLYLFTIFYFLRKH